MSELGRRQHYGEFYGLRPIARTGAPLLAVLGNCQAEALRITATGTAGAPALDSVRIPPIHELTAEDLPHLDRLLPELDVLAAQPVRADYRGLPLGTAQVRSRMREDARLVPFPTTRDASAYPFQVIARVPGLPDPPGVPYHDLRTAARAAGVAGGPDRLDPEARADAYRAIRDESLAELVRRHEQNGGLRVDDLVAANLGTSWVINHPSNPILLGLGERLRTEVGVAGEAVDPGRVLLRSVRAPLDPEVVEALDLIDEPRATWELGGVPVDDAEIVTVQLAWYAEHPEAVDAVLARYRERIRLLGWEL